MEDEPTGSFPYPMTNPCIEYTEIARLIQSVCEILPK